MNKLKKIRFEVISQNIENNININEIEFGNLKFYSKDDRSANINITTNLTFDLIENNTTFYNPIIQKIKLKGISGSTDQNADIREFEFIGLGNWGSGDRRSGNYQIDITTNLSTAQYPLTPEVFLNNWVDGGKKVNATYNSLYLAGNNIQVNNTSYILFDFVGTADKPKLTDFKQFLIYFDRSDISIDSDLGTWELIVIDENDKEHIVIKKIVLNENKLISDYKDNKFLSYDTNIKSTYNKFNIITNNTNDYTKMINGNYNNIISINKNQNIYEKYIEFEFDLNYKISDFLNGLSYTKIYWNINNKITSNENIYPSDFARLYYFKKQDETVKNIHNIDNHYYGNGTYEVEYSTYTENSGPYYVFSSTNNNAQWAINQYDNGNYIGNNNFGNLGTYGDWITIKMPVNIIPTKIRFVCANFDINNKKNLPKLYRFYGFYNNKWEKIIDTMVNNTEYESYNNIDNIAYTKSITNSKSYDYFALIVAKIGNSNQLAMSNFEIFGKEIKTNYENLFASTGITNWTKIKHLPARSAGSTWYSGNTFGTNPINGNYNIGNNENDDEEWAIQFNPDNVEYYLFVTRDSDYDANFKDRWVIIEKSEMEKLSYYNASNEYSSSYVHYYKSSVDINGFKDKTSEYYKGPNNDQLIYNNNLELYYPTINLNFSYIYGSHTNDTPYLTNHYVYLENSATEYNGAPPVVCEVYVKYNTIDNQNNLELKTTIYDTDGNTSQLNNTILNEDNLVYEIKNNNLTSYNLTKYNLLKEVRQYPPIFKSRKLLFKNFFIKNKIYGNGKYEVNYSSNNVKKKTPLNVFRYNYYEAMWANNNYTLDSNTFNSLSTYNGTSYIKDSNYKGDWITIKLPYEILITQCIFSMLNHKSVNPTSYQDSLSYFPFHFRIYGKNDDWELIIDQSITRDSLNNYYNNDYNNTVTDENKLKVAYELNLSNSNRLTKFKTFKEYGLVVNKIGGEHYLSFSSWDIYGYEISIILDEKPTNVPTNKNIKFSQIASVFDNSLNLNENLNSKNIKLKNFYISKIPDYNFNTSIPNTGSISFSNFKNTSSYIDDIPALSNIYARYQVEYEYLEIVNDVVTVWKETYGRTSRNITNYKGTPRVTYFEKGTKGTTGDNFFNIIKGDYNSGYKMPFSISKTAPNLSTNYTFCYVARYVGNKNYTAFNGRIFDAAYGTINNNTLWGFHGGNAGRSYNYISKWFTTTNSQHSEPDYWMIGVETQTTARYNGQDCTSYYNVNYNSVNYPQPSNNYNVQLTINWGRFTGGKSYNEISNWEVAEMIFYDKELSLTEKKSVESYLAKKYGHISFKDVINTLDDFKTLVKSENYINDLSDMWYYVYDGYKYGYSNITDKFYGPASFRFSFKKYVNTYSKFIIFKGYVDVTITKYYWMLLIENTTLNRNGYDYTKTDSERNYYNYKYNIDFPNTNEDYYSHMVSIGGGGGGGKSLESYLHSGGGGAGGMSYISNKKIKNYIVSVEIGSKGARGTNTSNNSAGGDTTIITDVYQIVGKGGYQGYDNGNINLALGGAYSGGDGGGYGGNSIYRENYRDRLGGKISEVLKSVNIYEGVNFWDLLDEFYDNWVSINFLYNNNSELYYGAGGLGARKSTPYAGKSTYASSGGSGTVIIILDYNDLSISRTSNSISESRTFDNYYINFKSNEGTSNLYNFVIALGGNTNLTYSSTSDSFVLMPDNYSAYGYIQISAPTNYNKVTIGFKKITKSFTYQWYTDVIVEIKRNGTLINNKYASENTNDTLIADIQANDLINIFVATYYAYLKEANVLFYNDSTNTF